MKGYSNRFGIDSTGCLGAFSFSGFATLRCGPTLDCDPPSTTRTRSQRRRDNVDNCGDCWTSGSKFAIHHNLGNFLRTLATPGPMKDWSLTSLKRS
jgi:hypothetical protein